MDERKQKLKIGEYPSDYYKLYQIDNLRLNQKLRIKYYKNVFSDFKEVKKFINNEEK